VRLHCERAKHQGALIVMEPTKFGSASASARFKIHGVINGPCQKRSRTSLLTSGASR
jgi:hypothetical protein